MNGPRRHAPWCAATIQHSTCHWVVKVIDLAAGLRVIVEVNRAHNVPALVTIAVDRGPHRTLVPLNGSCADELGAALTLAGQMARQA